MCALESAWLADEAGERAAALRWMELAAADPKTASGDRIKGKIAAGYLTLYGAPAASGAALASSAEALLAAGKAALASPNWWFHVDASDAYAVAARTLEALGRAGEADRAWRQALTALDGIDEPVYERRVARVRATVAVRLAAHPPHLSEARTLAAAALAWYRLAGGYERDVATLAALAAR